MTGDSMSHTVLLTANCDDIDSTEYDHVIAIDDILTRINQDDIIETERRVSSLDVSDTGCIAFPVVWRRLTNSEPSIVRAIVFAKQLQRHIEELGITHGTLICGESLKKPYVRVIEDVVKTIPLETEQQNRKELSPILIGIVSTLGVITKIVAVVVDWIVVWLATLGRSPMKNNIVYLPPIERINSTLPVVRQFTTSPQPIITEPSWYYALQSEIKASLDEFDPVNINQYVSVSGFLGQIKDLGIIMNELLSTKSFTPALTAAVEAEFDLYLESTIRGIVRSTLSNTHLVRALLLRRPLQTLFSADHTKKVIIGALDPVGRAIVHEATEHSVQVYHIPHSVATTSPPYIESDVVQFVSGTMDTQYYEQAVPHDRWWQWVPAGRPYLNDLAEQYGNTEDNQLRCRTENSRFKLVIATQPFERRIVKQFVETVLSSCSPDQFELIIKPHPDEDYELYEEIESEHENVHLITDNLYEAIAESDLTVTISSNVGIESVVIGTPCVCYNAYEPFILDQTFGFADEVPIFRSADEFKKFVSHLDRNKLSQLRSQQQTFVEENYCLESDIATTIASYIQSDRRAENPES
jgi:hypothetical protein